MKYISALFAILAVIGLGQAHPFPDFRSDSLGQDFEDLMNLVPTEKITDIAMDYIMNDPDCQELVNDFLTKPWLKDTAEAMQAMDEFRNLCKYIQDEGVDIVSAINKINEILGLPKFELPLRSHSAVMERTGGVPGLIIDIIGACPFLDIFHTFAEMCQNSPPFINLMKELKSENSQQLVNKVYEVPSFQEIVNKLKEKEVRTHVAADILFVVLGITVPGSVSAHQECTLKEALMAFGELIPQDQFIETAIKYAQEDQKVQEAIRYIQTPEFHSRLRELEALKEYETFVIYMEKECKVPIIKAIQLLHELIGMEDYVPPEIENIFKSGTGIQKIGDGMKGMCDDLYGLLPLDKIDALFNEKMQTCKPFANFVEKLTSPEMKKLMADLSANPICKDFITVTKENGLEIFEIIKLVCRAIGLKFPY